MRAKFEARKSESAGFRLRLMDTENEWAKSKAEAATVTSLANSDEERVVHRLMERVQALEAEIASLRWSEKSFERRMDGGQRWHPRQVPQVGPMRDEIGVLCNRTDLWQMRAPVVYSLTV